MYTLLAYDGSKFYPINFSKSPYFKDYDMTKLKDIILFSTSFSTEENLIDFLKDYKIMPDINVKYFVVEFKRGKTSQPSILFEGLPLKGDKPLYKIERLIREYQLAFKDIDTFSVFVDTYYDKIINSRVDKFKSSIKELHYCYKFYKYNHQMHNDVDRKTEDFIKTYLIDKDKISLTKMTELILFLRFLLNKQYNKNNDVLNEIKNKKEELEHYKYMISYGALNSEQRHEYENKIDELERFLGGR